MKRALSLLSLLMLFSSPAIAQVSPVPPLMNFQGRLARPDGTPLAEGNYSVRFSLWDASAGGTEKWNQTQNVTARNGVFAVLLSNFPTDTFNGNLWLEVKVGTNAPLTPRQQLVTVAYAMKANSVPDGSIGAAQLANGAITADKFATNLLNPLAWLLGGNSGTNPASNFLGTTDNQPLVFKVNGRRAMQYQYAENTARAGFEYRSINVLGGNELNNIAPGVLGATIAGGGVDDFTLAGYPNQVLADFGAIGGGAGNTASGTAATIAGGTNNTASGWYTTIAGGTNNTASGTDSTIAGGTNNTASSSDSTVGGGNGNTASYFASTVAGGANNIASGYASIVAGGFVNMAVGAYSFAAGQQAQAKHTGSFVWNDASDTIFGNTFGSSGDNQFLIHATGGVGINTNNPGGAALKVDNGGGTAAGLVVELHGSNFIVRPYNNGSNQAVIENTAGSIYCNSPLTVVGFTNLSDARYKQNVATFPDALAAVLNLRGVTFDWRQADYPDMNFTQGRQVGFIAQEVEKVLPELVKTDERGYKSVAYANVVPVLVEAVKALKKDNDAIRTENAALKAKVKEIDDLKAEMATLAEKVAQMETAKTPRK